MTLNIPIFHIFKIVCCPDLLAKLIVYMINSLYKANWLVPKVQIINLHVFKVLSPSISFNYSPVSQIQTSKTIIVDKTVMIAYRILEINTKERLVLRKIKKYAGYPQKHQSNKPQQIIAELRQLNQQQRPKGRHCQGEKDTYPSIFSNQKYGRFASQTDSQHRRKTDCALASTSIFKTCTFLAKKIWRDSFSKLIIRNFKLKSNYQQRSMDYQQNGWSSAARSNPSACEISVSDNCSCGRQTSSHTPAAASACIKQLPTANKVKNQQSKHVKQLYRKAGHLEGELIEEYKQKNSLSSQ